MNNAPGFSKMTLFQKLFLAGVILAVSLVFILGQIDEDHFTTTAYLFTILLITLQGWVIPRLSKYYFFSVIMALILSFFVSNFIGPKLYAYGVGNNLAAIIIFIPLTIFAAVGLFRERRKNRRD